MYIAAQAVVHKEAKISKNAFLCIATLIRRTCARQEHLQSFVDAFLAAMTYIIFHMDSRHDIEPGIISYEQDTESYPTDVLLEYQQCQMQCNHYSCSDSDDVQDTVPVAEPTLIF